MAQTFGFRPLSLKIMRLLKGIGKQKMNVFILFAHHELKSFNGAMMDVAGLSPVNRALVQNFVSALSAPSAPRTGSTNTGLLM